jgi:hypothetical protein
MGVDTLFLGRIIERILVVIFGGLSLFLGWRLFIVGVVDPQIAEIKFRDWKVSLRQVGPGTVFAALGIAVMGIALFRPLEVSGNAGAGGKPVTDTRSVSYMGTPEDLRHWVRALNTVARVDPARLQQDTASATAMKAELARAQQTVIVIRDILLLEKFSQSDIATWQKYQSAYLENPLSVPGDVRPTLSALEPWMTTTVADER